MAGAGGLADIILAFVLGIILVIAAIGPIIYGLVGANARRAFYAGVVGLVISASAALLSYPFWEVILSGRDSHGEPIDYGDFGFVIGVLSIEVIAILTSVLAVIKQKRRLKRAAAVRTGVEPL
jgi:hypothetical protein